MKKRYHLLVLLLVIVNYSIYGQAGTLDNSFSLDGKVTTDFGNSDEEAFAAVMQPDGKIIVAGYTLCCSAAEDFAMVRYNVNGTIDNSFGNAGKTITNFNNILVPTDIAHAITLQSDGKIIMGGQAFNGNVNDFAIARYDSSGILDNTFGNGGKVTTSFGSLINSVVHSIVVQLDGKIIAAGFALSSNDFAMVRYNINGSIDTTFGVNGKVISDLGGGDEINSIRLQPDGKIVAAGKSENANYYDSIAVVRYATDGTVDATFGNNGYSIHMIGNNSGVESMTLQPDGKIVIAGGASTGSYAVFYVARLDSSGFFDTTFGTNGIVTTNFMTGNESYAKSVLVQPDGKIIAAGTVNKPYYVTLSNNDFGLARYNADGTPDLTFGVNGKDTTDFGTTASFKYSDYGYAVMLDPAGRIVLAGTSNMNFAAARYLNNLVLGIFELSDNEQTLTVYPNPLHDIFEINFTLLKKQKLSIKLADMQGKYVQTFISEKYYMEGNHKEKLQMKSSIANGNYILSIENGNQRMSIHLLKN